MLKFGAIGCGNMASAILKGVADSYPAPFELWGYDVSPEKTAALSGLGLHSTASIKELAEKSDYVLLSVKPQQIGEVLAELAKFSSKDRVYLSIAAGVSSARIKEGLGFDARVVPIMPNTPLLLGAGATAMAWIPPVSREEFEEAKRIFGCAGLVEEIPESKMKEVIAINGSSPAFLYAFAQGFLRYGAEQGIPEAACLRLFCQSMRGAAQMLEHSGMEADQLIQMVSSKGGTTIAGLEALRAHGLEEAVAAACKACTKRAYEL